MVAQDIPLGLTLMTQPGVVELYCWYCLESVLGKEFWWGAWGQANGAPSGTLPDGSCGLDLMCSYMAW